MFSLYNWQAFKHDQKIKVFPVDSYVNHFAVSVRTKLAFSGYFTALQRLYFVKVTIMLFALLWLNINTLVDQYERLLKHEITRYDRLTKAQQNSIDQLETQLSNTEQRLANARSEQNSLLKQEIEDLKRQNLTVLRPNA